METPVALQIFGVILALAILMVGALRGKKITLLAIIGVLVVAITNGQNIWETFSSTFVSGLQSALASFFLLVFSVTCYSIMMNRTGSTNAIAYWCIRKFGKSHAVLVIMAITGILGLAGLNGMMMVFAVYGILIVIMKEADLPRELAAAFIFFGCGMFAEGYFPASVHMNNILPTQFLNTTLLAAPVLGLVTGCICIVLSYLYFTHVAKKARLTGNGWTDTVEGSYVVPKYGNFTEENCPSAIKAFIPMLFMIVLVIILSQKGLGSGMIAVCSMISAAVICAALNWNTLKDSNVTAFGYLQEVYDQTWNSCGPLALLLGFGTVVTASAGFQAILNWVVSLNISTYLKGILSVGVLSAATGSSATGLRLTGTYLGEYFVNSGVNLDILHRFMAIASANYCEVPHCNAIYLIVGMFGVKYMKGYKHIFMVTVVTGTIALLVGYLGVMILGL